MKPLFLRLRKNAPRPLVLPSTRDSGGGTFIVFAGNFFVMLVSPYPSCRCSGVGTLIVLTGNYFAILFSRTKYFACYRKLFFHFINSRFVIPNQLILVCIPKIQPPLCVFGFVNFFVTKQHCQISESI